MPTSIVAIFYPFSQYCEINISLLSLQKQPKRALDVEHAHLGHTCHILPPSEIDLGLFLAAFAVQEGDTYFTELAERVEYGNYVAGAAWRGGR